MTNAIQSLFALTAKDLMSSDLFLISGDVPMRAAAHMLLRHRVSGAPVVDQAGKLVGVISTTDFVRVTEKTGAEQSQLINELDSCLFQSKSRDASGKEVVLCELPLGVCSVQRRHQDASGKELIVCGEPHGVFADWQIAILDSVPMDAVKKFMTRDIVTASPNASIRALARDMVDARVHRVIVVEADGSPIGVVTSTNILEAVAKAAQPARSPG